MRTTVGAGVNVSTVFKFHRSVKLGPGNWLTVWSSTASNQIHEPCAGSIVMNTQAWVVGDLMATILLNAEGKVCSFKINYFMLLLIFIFRK